MWRRSSWTTNFSFKGFFSVYLKTFHFISVADTVTLSLYYFTERLNSSRKTTANTINPNKYFIFIHHICAQFKRSIYIVFGVWISVKQWKRQKERERERRMMCVCTLPKSSSCIPIQSISIPVRLMIVNYMFDTQAHRATSNVEDLKLRANRWTMCFDARTRPSYFLFSVFG